MANTFSPYQRASLAQFTPISAQQMWAPITFAIEQEQKGMDMLSTLDGDLNRAAIMAVGDPDGERIINQYREKLKSAGQNLYVNGVTPRTMQDVRSLQNMFSQAVTPLMVGFANRDAYYKRELAKADADPTFRFNHPKMSLTEWATSDVANMPVQGASAAMVQAQVANALAPFAKKTFFDGETLKNLKGFLPVRIGDQDVDTYLSYIERKGYDPDSPEGQILFNAAKANVYEMLKITQNGARNPIFTDTDMFAFDSAANLAKTAMTGETQMNTIKNPEFEMAYQDYKDKRDFDQAMALAQMRIDAAGKGTGTGGSKGEGKGKDGEVTGYNPANLSRSYNEPASTTAIRNEEKIAEANDVISRGKTLDNTVYSKMKNGLESRINLVAQYTYEDRNKDGIPETGFNPENKKKLISRVKDIVGNMESGKYVSIDDMIEDYDRSEAPYEGWDSKAWNIKTYLSDVWDAWNGSINEYLKNGEYGDLSKLTSEERLEIVNGVSQEGMDYKTVKFNHSSVQEALKQYVVNDTSNPFFMVEKGKKVNAKDKLKELYRINNKDVKPTDDETILIKDALKHLTPADISLQTYNTIAGKPVIEITTAVGTFYRKAPNEIQNALTFFTEVNKQINALRKGKKKMQVVTYKDGEGNTWEYNVGKKDGKYYVESVISSGKTNEAGKPEWIKTGVFDMTEIENWTNDGMDHVLTELLKTDTKLIDQYG